MILKEVPYFERPREKVSEQGIESLSIQELLAILIQTGTKNKNVLEVAKDVLYLLNDLSDLSSITYQELTSIDGIGNAKAISILSAVELGKRISSYRKKNLVFKNPVDVFLYFYPIVKDYKKEVVICVYLDIKGNVISIKELSTGTIDCCIIDSKEILKWAIKLSSKNIVLLHNHPSGDPEPSKNDLSSTYDLIQSAKTLDIKIIDHIIIGETFVSLKRENSKYKLFKS